METLAIGFWHWLTADLSTWLERLAHLCLVCSILSNALPPIEQFQDFPQFQKYYALFVNLVYHYGALNFRGKIIKFRANGKEPEENAKSDN